MTTEEKREILRSYRNHMMAARKIKEELHRLESSVLPKSASFDGMPHGSDNERDLSGWAAKCNELEHKLQMEYERQIEAGNRIMDGIKGLTDPMQKTVILERYISLKRIETIAEEMNFSEATIWRAHRKALQKIKL